jgi:hypothetical protein
MSHKEWEGRRARKRVRTWVRSELAVKKPRDEKYDKDKQDEEDDHEEVASKNRKDDPKTTDEGSKLPGSTPLVSGWLKFFYLNYFSQLFPLHCSCARNYFVYLTCSCARNVTLIVFCIFKLYMLYFKLVHITYKVLCVCF